MPGRRVLKFFCYTLGIALLGLVGFSWGFQYIPYFFDLPWPSRWGVIGNFFGLLGLYSFVLMTAVGTRVPIWEKAFGLNRLIQFHRAFGLFVVIFVLMHVIFRTIAYSASLDERWSWDFVFQFFPNSWNISENVLIAARWGVLALILGVFSAKAGQLMKRFMPFCMWKPLHFLVYFTGIVAFGHPMFLSLQMSHFPLLLTWLILAGSWGGIAIYRLNYISRRTENFMWLMERVDYETHDVHTCHFIRQQGPGPLASWYPGQFIIVRMKSRLWGWSEPHPFTISCAPGTGKISCTIKGVGSFSKKLRTCRPGIKFLCEGPYGVFTPDFHKERNLIFVAGGIGITPFLSMIRYVRDNKIDVSITLIWGNKFKKDIIAYSELSQLAKFPDQIKIIHVLSEQKITEKMREETAKDGFYWEQGFVTGAILRKYVNPEKASFYVCGPPPMQRWVLKEVQSVFSISPRKVNRELFVLY